MSRIPLIFTRPFQSIHFSLGNIAHTCLYASPLTASIGTLGPAWVPPPRLSWNGERARSPVFVGQRRSHRCLLEGSCFPPRLQSPCS